MCLALTSPLEGEVGEALRAGWGVKLSGWSDVPPTRRVQSDAATSPSRGEVKAKKPRPPFNTTWCEGFTPE